MDLKQIISNFEKAKQAFKDVTQQSIVSLFDSIFKKHTYLVSFTIYGWVDYFNDGDPCTFSMHTYNIPAVLSYNKKIMNVRIEDTYVCDDNNNEELTDVPDSIRTFSDEIETITCEVPNDLWQETFGDHFYLTICSNGEFSTGFYGKHD